MIDPKTFQATLRQELDDSAYDNLTAAQAADLLNAKTITTYRTLSGFDVMVYLLAEGLIGAIKTDADNPSSQTQATSQMLLSIHLAADGYLDATNPQHQAIIADLVENSVVTQEQADALIAKTVVVGSYVRQLLGVAFVTKTDIENAKGTE